MKLPEPLFVIINPVVTFLLRSPVHGICSNSLMLITFTGRKSRRKFTTPVRYVPVDGVIRCFTSATTLWWRNLKGGADVMLRVAGKEAWYRADAIFGQPERIKSALIHYLALFPQDAAYHDIGLNKDKSLNEQDLARAAREVIVVEARPL
jgi:hypothetical protein